MYRSLIAIAQEPSSERRREVLQRISSMFVEGADAFSDRELLLFSDILTRLLDQVAIGDRIETAERIARIAQTPRVVAMRLATDDVEVAAPVLQYSNALTESDLLQVASEKGQGHLLAMSQRETLSGPLTDILVQRGEAQVLTSVASNPGATFSAQGLSALAEKASTTKGLGEILSQRNDLPQDVIARIMPMLDQCSRKRMEFLLEHDHGAARALVNLTQKEVAATRGDTRRERMEALVIVADIRDGKRTLDDAIVQLCREKRIPDVAYTLSEFSSIPIAQMINVIHKTDPAGIALVCQALDINDRTYAELCHLRREKLKLPHGEVERFVHEYRAIDKQTAERALRFHKVRLGATH